MARSLVTVAALVAVTVSGVDSASLLRPKASLASMGAKMSKAMFEEKVRKLKEANPYFAKETCTTMFDTKKRLGGSVPPAEFVLGCPEVCDMIRAIKEYWHSGDMATFACEHAADFGCVYDGTPPVTAADIGC